MQSLKAQAANDAIVSVLEDARLTFSRTGLARADIGSILSLYGSITSLCARAKRIRVILTNQKSEVKGNSVAMDRFTDSEAKQFSGFFQELTEFGERLSDVSLAAIEIYYPGLKNDLMKVVGGDIDFSRYYIKEIVPKYQLSEATMPATLINILDQFSGDWGPENAGYRLWVEVSTPSAGKRSSGSAGYTDIGYGTFPNGIFVDNFLAVAESLDKCRGIISAMVKENWNFRDLAGPVSSVSVNIEGGINMAETRYNVSNSQVGAIGPNAIVHDLQFQQRVEQLCQSIDLKVLSEQLDQLRSELAKSATERDHYAAVVAISDAAADARAGKGTDALSKLAQAGMWAFDVATKIGVSVAAEAIKVALGMK